MKYKSLFIHVHYVGEHRVGGLGCNKSTLIKYSYI